MKKHTTFLAFVVFYLTGYTQTLYVPSGSSGIGVSSNQNVGIGVSGPSEKLHVNGNLLVRNHIRFGKSHVTDINFLTDSYGGAHALLFNAYKGAEVNWITNETYYSNDAGAHGGGAGSIIFLGNGGRLNFYISDVSTGAGTSVAWNAPKMTINRGGSVGIGMQDLPAGYRFGVDGKAIVEEVKVAIVEGTGPDYVFEPDYNLSTLEETKAYIKQNKHLPEIPSAREMEANGIELGEMNMLLLKKIEELTLYVIEQNERIKELEAKVEGN